MCVHRGGVALLAEQLSPRLVVASTFILGGVALAVTIRKLKTRLNGQGKLNNRI